MKILLISHMYPSTFNQVAGIFVHEQMKALVRKGIEVKVISPVPWAPFPINRLSSKWEAYSRIPPKDMWEGVEIYYPRYLVFPRAFYFASSGERMYRGIKDFVRNVYDKYIFDLIFAHVALPDGFAAIRLKERYNVPVVITIHGKDLQITLHRNGRCKKALMKVFDKADRIIVVSTKLERIARAEIGFDDKIRIINNGVDPKKMKFTKNVLAFNHSGCKTILSVSNLVKSKGIDLNLIAVSKLIEKHPMLKYVVIGDGPDRKRLVKLVSNLGVDSQVEFIGRLTHEKVIKFMKEIDIFSMPSWLEGFGVVYLEAMACGKPTIACIGEGIEDVITQGKTGILVKPKDVDNLVEALDFLLSNPEITQAIGERARKNVLEHYTWEKNTEKTIEIFGEVVKAW